LQEVGPDAVTVAGVLGRVAVGVDDDIRDLGLSVRMTLEVSELGVRHVLDDTVALE